MLQRPGPGPAPILTPPAKATTEVVAESDPLNRLVCSSSETSIDEPCPSRRRTIREQSRPFGTSSLAKSRGAS